MEEIQKRKRHCRQKQKRDACDAGPAAVFGDFADELGDRKGTPGAERYFCFRARFRSAKTRGTKFGDTASVIPSLSAGVFEGSPAEISFCPGLCYDTRTASAKGEDGTILSAQKTNTRGDGIRRASPGCGV